MRIVAPGQRRERSGPIAPAADAGGEEAGMDPRRVPRPGSGSEPKILSRRLQIPREQPPVDPPQATREKRFSVTRRRRLVKQGNRLPRLA